MLLKMLQENGKIGLFWKFYWIEIVIEWNSDTMIQYKYRKVIWAFSEFLAYLQPAFYTEQPKVKY